MMGMGMGMGGSARSTTSATACSPSTARPSTYQTNLGAVAALDAETGGIRWVATYPRQERERAGRRVATAT